MTLSQCHQVAAKINLKRRGGPFSLSDESFKAKCQVGELLRHHAEAKKGVTKRWLSLGPRVAWGLVTLVEFHLLGRS